MRGIGVRARIGFIVVTALLVVPLVAGRALAGAGKTTHIPAFYDGNQVTPVIDAIQGDGFNPLWHQVLIVFNAGFAPHQFLSDEEVLAAADAGEITLLETDEVYVCAVVGAK